MLKLKLCKVRTFNARITKNFGSASFYSKYLIIGGGFAGKAITHLLTSVRFLLIKKPYEIKGNDITLIDSIPDYTIFPYMKYHSYGIKNTVKTNAYIPHSLPSKVKFRHNEILQIMPEENLVLGDKSLRHSYDKLILASGLDPDFSSIPGLLYSLRDRYDPIFTTYDYDEGIIKISNYTHYLAKLYLLDSDYKLTKENEEFINTGLGNIIFVNCTGDFFEIISNMQMIILLFDFIKIFREAVLKNMKFFLYLPIDIESYKKFPFANNISDYFLKLLNERNIEIKWSHSLQEVQMNQNLKFSNLEGEENIRYNYSLIFPKLLPPNFIRYNDQFLDTSVNSYLNLSKYKNIYALGDILNISQTDQNFLDRFHVNIFKQAKTLSDNLKINHFRLNQNKIKEYHPHHKVFFDFVNNEFILIDIQKEEKNSIESLKKNYINRFFFDKFYYNPESYFSSKFLKEKMGL